jgi:hypothetical protein
MLNKDTLKWFVGGFVLTSLVLLAVAMLARPTIGWAQGGDEGNPNFWSLVVEDPPPGPPSADGPEGQVTPVPVVDNGAERSNWEAMVPGDDTSSADGPEGQVAPAPLVDNGTEQSNWEAMVVDDNPYPNAVEAIEAGYQSPLVISAADFSSDGFDPDGFYFSFAGGYINGDGSACLKAPAYLPQGATVTSVYASLYDNASDDVTVNLRRVNRSTGATDVMASVSTASNSTSIQQRGDTSISYPDISYPTYAYYVTTCLSYANHRVYAVRIYYTGP